MRGHSAYGRHGKRQRVVFVCNFCLINNKKIENKIRPKILKKWKEKMAIFVLLFLVGLTINMQDGQRFETLNPCFT